MAIAPTNIPAVSSPKIENRPRSTRPALIELKNVFKIYENAAGKYPALNGISLKIDAGEFVAIIGKSGSGKTTLMNIITGIDRPTTGEVIVAGTRIHSLREGDTAIWRGNTVGIVFQFFQLLPTLTVIENVMLPMDFCHRYSLRERRQKALDLLDQVELASYAHRLPSALSGGQQQRVAIARALANDPPILVADEPTGNLDSSTATSVINLFSKLVRQGKTIVMVTHDQDLVRHVVRTIFLKDGRVTGDNVTTADKEGLQATPQLTVESLDRTKIDEETGSDNQNSNPMPGSIADTIADILADPNNAAGKLREILDETPGDREERETLYQLIYEQVKNKADQAEQIGDLEAARKYWSILIDLTRK